MVEEVRAAQVVGFENRVFVLWQSRSAQGLDQVYAITETTREPGTLGRELKQALNAPWPDISPSPADLVQGLANTAGVSSHTRFVTRSACVSVDQKAAHFHLVPLKPDGRAGYNGVRDSPHYELNDPSDRALGEAALRALKDSFQFPDRPKVR